MRIAYLDTKTLDRGDIDFAPLRNLGELTLHPLTGRDERIERAREADIVLVNKVILDREVLEACANSLRYVVVTATGTNNVDTAAAKHLGIPVSNVSGYSTESVAQHTLGTMLNLATSINRYAAEPLKWTDSPMFTRLDYPVFELSGKTLGIVGLGTIGKRVAELAQAFGMRVIALSRNESSSDGEIPRFTRDDFFAQADFVSLHCPLTKENTEFINADTLALMKPTAFLINTGRGPLVHEADLLAALQTGEIAGAGLDVLAVEPPAAHHPLLVAKLPNLFVTPHSAWASVESRTRLLDAVCANIRAFSDGAEIPNRVA